MRALPQLWKLAGFSPWNMNFGSILEMYRRSPNTHKQRERMMMIIRRVGGVWGPADRQKRSFSGGCFIFALPRIASAILRIERHFTDFCVLRHARLRQRCCWPSEANRPTKENVKFSSVLRGPHEHLSLGLPSVSETNPLLIHHRSCKTVVITCGNGQTQ